METLKRFIGYYVSRNEIERAIQYAIDNYFLHDFSETFLQEMTLLLARWKELQKKKRLGIINYQDEQMSTNILVTSLLGCLDMEPTEPKRIIPADIKEDLYKLIRTHMNNYGMIDAYKLIGLISEL